MPLSFPVSELPMSLTDEEKALIGTAFDWLEEYTTRCVIGHASRPAPQGTLYEAWCTLTLVHMLHGFSRSAYPLNQMEPLPDFISRSRDLLRRLEETVVPSSDDGADSD